MNIGMWTRIYKLGRRIAFFIGRRNYFGYVISWIQGFVKVKAALPRGIGRWVNLQPIRQSVFLFHN